MKGEIPVFRRCCCCLPLRYGLLAWGYFKLIADALLFVLMIFISVHTFMMIRLYANEKFIGHIYTELVVTMIAIVIFFADFIVTIVFIIGGHKKNVRLITVFYYMSMGMWVVTFLLAFFVFVMSILDLIEYKRPWMLEHMLISLCFYFVALVVQTYFLLLLRSEIIKLRNTGEFRFVNNAADAECSMKCEEIVVGAKTEQQDSMNINN